MHKKYKHNKRGVYMRNLSVFSIVLSTIVLLIHILFDLKKYMPFLMANILIAIFTFVFLIAVFYLVDQKKDGNHSNK